MWSNVGRSWTVITFLLIMLAATSVCEAEDRLPHVVCIMADDLGWMDLSCQGNRILRTPALDRLATQGVRFTDAYAASPVCSPTRAAMMTGLAPARLRITQHGSDGKQFWPPDRVVQPASTNFALPHEVRTVAERLKARGYAAGFFGKWHLGETAEHWPTRKGFEVNVGGCAFGGPPTYFDPYRIPTINDRKTGEYLTERLADEAIAFLRERKDQPMFVCLWTYNPHYPFEAPEALVKPFVGKEGKGLKNPVYGGQIAATDRAVGRVLKALDELRIADETLVIFTSDNGGWSGATDNRPLREGKGYLYEGGIRVPLIIRWPGVTPSGTRQSTPVISMDVAATILAAAGIETSELEMDGESLRPLLEGQTLGRDALYFHYPHFAFHKSNRPGSAIRKGQHKLIFYDDDRSVELFDLEQDIGETTDLSHRQPKIADDLKEQLLNWLNEVEAARPTKMKASPVPSQNSVSLKRPAQ